MLDKYLKNLNQHNNKVCILGLGGLGSHLIQLIRNLDIKIVCIDHDNIESKNTLSQFHSKTNIRKSKVQSISQTMQFLWGTKLETIPHKLTKDNVDSLLKGAYLVVDTFDNGASRRLVQEYTLKNNIPCVHGGLAANGEFGLVRWNTNFKIDNEPADQKATCEDGEHLAFIALTSAYLAMSVKEFINNSKQIEFNIYPGGANKI